MHLPISSHGIGASALTALQVQVQNLYNHCYKYYQRYINRAQKVFKTFTITATNNIKDTLTELKKYSKLFIYHLIDTATLSQIINGSRVETRSGQPTHIQVKWVTFSRMSESLS